jgi:hypothetical protein
MTSLELDSKSQAELVHTLLGAYFETLQSDLVVARAFQVKIDALGPAARERRRESLKLFAAFIRELVARTSPDGRPSTELPWSAYIGVYAARQLAFDALDETSQPDLVRLGADLESGSQICSAGDGLK